MTYHCKMDDGTPIDVRAPSAAEAMQIALERHLGHRVVSCRSGSDIGRHAGWTEFEVPRHEPATKAREKKKREKKPERTERAADWIEDFLATKNNDELPP